MQARWYVFPPHRYFVHYCGYWASGQEDNHGFWICCVCCIHNISLHLHFQVKFFVITVYNSNRLKFKIYYYALYEECILSAFMPQELNVVLYHWQSWMANLHPVRGTWNHLGCLPGCLCLHSRGVCPSPAH